MHVLDAAHQTVLDYPGGAESLAPRVGMSAGILRNKANPQCTTNVLSLAEANRIMAATGDHAILHALAHEHGYVLQRTDDARQAGQQMVDALVLELMQKTGNLAGTIADARADGVITANEAKDTSGAGFDVQDVVVRLVAAIHAQTRYV